MKIPVISNRAVVIIITCAAPVDIFFVAKNQEGRGMAASLAICGIVGLVVIFRRIWDDWRFWMTLATIALTNIAFVTLLPWGNRVAFGAMYAPIAIALFYLAAKVILRVVGETDD